MSNRTRQKRNQRARVIDRDGLKCHYCGASGDDTALTIDHVLALALGGSNTLANMVLACHPCNRRKGCKTPLQAGVAGAQPTPFDAPGVPPADSWRRRRLTATMAEASSAKGQR